MGSTLSRIGSYGAILQNVDVPMTEIDIVLKDTHENRRRLVSALDELMRENSLDTEENIDELRSRPDSMGDSIFRTFVTGFWRGRRRSTAGWFSERLRRLIENAFIATVQDEREPGDGECDSRRCPRHLQIQARGRATQGCPGTSSSQDSFSLLKVVTYGQIRPSSSEVGH